MISKEGYMEIKAMHRIGMSVRAIARELGLHRTTVKKHLLSDDFPRYRKTRRRESILEPYTPMIRDYLQEDDYRATWILERIRQAGYPGAYGIVRDYVRSIKQQKTRLAYVRFETEPGRQTQFDWADFQVVEPTGRTTTIFAFMMVLGFSRAAYAEFVERCTLESFLDGHIRAFRYLQGVPAESLYDNLKHVVIGRDAAGKPVFNAEFLHFAHHYGFTPIACPPYSPWMKGKVERPIDYLRERFWRGYHFTSVEKANEDVLRWLAETANRRVHGTHRRPVNERWEEEVPHLGPLPPADYDTSLKVFRKVYRDCQISFNANRYVVPHRAVGRKVMLKVKNGRIRIYHDQDLLVSYREPQGKHNVVADPRLYEELRHDKEQLRRRYGKSKGKATRGLTVGSLWVDVHHRPLAVSEKQYADWQASRAARKPGEVDLADIRVADTMKRVNPDVIEAEIRQKPTRIETQLEERLGRERTELETLHRSLTTVYGRGDFERLDYRLAGERERRSLVVEGIEKSWGPNYLKFGLGYASDFDEAQRFNFSVMHRMTWLNSLGAEWRNDLTMGYVNEFHTEFYQPFTRRVGVFAAPWLDVKRAPINYYIEDDWVGEYKVSTLRGGLDLGVQGRLGEMRLGYFYGKLKTDQKFGVLSAGTSLVPEYDLRQGGWMGKFILDQLDSARFPREGFLLGGTFFVTDPNFGADDDYNKFELTFQKPFNLDRHTLNLGLFYGESPDSRIPAYDLFKQGGFLHFSGYLLDQLVGQYYYMGRLVYTYRFADLPSALGGGIYLGGSFEAGEVGNAFDPTTASGTIYCGSVFLGVDTILGPFYFAFGQADDGSNSFYVMLGMHP